MGYIQLRVGFEFRVSLGFGVSSSGIFGFLGASLRVSLTLHIGFRVEGSGFRVS